jgi:hypothetical protein
MQLFPETKAKKAEKAKKSIDIKIDNNIIDNS